MTVFYHGPRRILRYQCTTGMVDFRASRCQSLSGRGVDELVEQRVFKALEPASLELSMIAADDLEKEQQRLDHHWRQRLERASFEADRAQRQVTVDRSLRLAEQRESIGGQWQERGPLTIGECAADLLARRPVDPSVGDMTLPIPQVRVLIGQARERSPFERVVLGVANPALDLALVTGHPNPRRQDHRPIVARKRTDLRRQLRIEPIRLRPAARRLSITTVFGTPPKCQKAFSKQPMKWSVV